MKKFALFAAIAVVMALAIAPEAAFAASTAVHSLGGSSTGIFGAAALAMTMAIPATEFGRKEAGPGDEKSLEALQKQLGETLGEVKEFAKEFRTKSEAGDKISADAKERNMPPGWG